MSKLKKTADSRRKTANLDYSIEELGMSLDEARDARARLAAFAEGWEDPEMECYDELFDKLHGKTKKAI